MFVVLPCSVLKGIYHCWMFFLFFPGDLSKWRAGEKGGGGFRSFGWRGVSVGAVVSDGVPVARWHRCTVYFFAQSCTRGDDD